MKKSKITLNKKISFKVIATLFFINICFYLPIQKVEAVFCSNCYNVMQGQVDLIKQTVMDGTTMAQKIADYKQISKEFFLDKMAIKISRTMIQQIQGSTINWINSGFKGKPMFLTNPSQFFSNIAIDQLSIVKDKLITDLRYANKSVAQALIKGTSNQLNSITTQLTPTIANEICMSLKNDLGIYQRLSESNPSKKNLVQSKKSQFDSVCSGSKESRYENGQKCASEFGCGGWAAISAVTSNLDINTEIGRLEIAKAEYDKALNEKKTEIKEELANSNGFLNNKKCSSYRTTSNGRQICTNEENMTPGIAAASALDQIVKDPVAQAQLADEIDEAILSIGDAFVNKIVSTGLVAVNSAVSGVTTEIQSALADLSKDLENSTQGAVNGINNQFTNIVSGIRPTMSNAIQGTNVVVPIYNTTQDTAIYFMTQKDKQAFFDILDISSKRSIDSNKRAASSVARELGEYEKVFSALDSINMCYKSKYDEQQKIIKSNPFAYLGPSALTYPGSIPENIKARTRIIVQEVNGLKKTLENGKSFEDDIKEYRRQMASTSDYRVFEELRVNMENRSEASLDESFWIVRDIQNSNGSDAGGNGLYAILTNEAKDLITDKQTGTDSEGNPITTPSPLTICNAFSLTPPVPAETINNFNDSR